MSTFFSELEARGIVKQVTDPGLGQALNTQSLTSDTLHIGSLFPLMTLRRFQMAGHRIIAVVGGATGMIGDPSGKSAERSLLNEEQLAKNVEGLKKTMSRFLDFSDPKKGILVDNASWFKPISFIDFLRDVGKHFTINHMMAKESVRARLEDREHGISYTEFSYMLLQAYDFYHLYKHEGCTLQFGGSEQWGNITAGIDLIRRMNAHDSPDNTANPHQSEVFGLTHPLVLKADGTKFGKTETGTIWLDPKRTSAYQFYQFFIQTADTDVGTYLKYFTFLSLDEIQALEESVKTEPEKRKAQIALAREVTAIVHGKSEVERVEKASQALFGEGVRELDEKTLIEILSGAPQTKMPRSRLAEGVSLADALTETALCASRGAAKKDLAGGGVYVNNVRVSDAQATLKETDLIAGGHILLRKGKKTYHLLSFT
jgi:tyrosyl-tRNA synthetase